jgi:hypothetical protein
MKSFHITRENVSDCLIRNYYPNSAESKVNEIASISLPETRVNFALQHSKLDRTALILWILTAERLERTEVVLLSLLFRLKVESKFLPIINPYTFRLFVYGIECQELSSDLLLLFEYGLVEINDQNGILCYSLSETGYINSEIVVNRLSEFMPSLRASLEWMQKTSWAQQITYFYTTYPELRATNRS